MRLNSNERFIVIAVCVLVSILTSLDIAEDLKEGSPLSHTIVEASIVFILTSFGLYTWKNSLKKQIHLKRNLDLAMKESKEWQEETKSLREGLSRIIDEQFKSWGLTPAEFEVAWLLIKGLSQKKIAEIRSTSEKTIRQQATTIYKKANVSSRSELSAIFVEDLL
jgi:DNA-binding CsgD family transcriptional regulator